MALCPKCGKSSNGSYCIYCGAALAPAPQPARPGWVLPANFLLTSNGGWHSYRIGAVLGQGGFGITYVAHLQDNGQKVAIKEHFPRNVAQRNSDFSISPVDNNVKAFDEGLKNFLREAKLQAGLNNLPSVVKVIDFFQANGTAYLVMEYLDGKSLRQMVESSGPISANLLMPRLKALLKDMEAMHKQGVLHRDVAPDNIMWMPNGTLRLMDFGSARPATDDEKTGMVKSGFTPIEQWQTKGQGPWSDVYGISATTYYCLTGRIPPDAFQRLDNPKMPTPSELGFPLPAQQERTLMWGLGIQVSERPSSIQTFMTQLYQGTSGPVVGGKFGIPPIKSVDKIQGIWSEKKGLILGIAAAAVTMLLFIILLVSS